MLTIILFLGLIMSSHEGEFDFKLKYCGLKCGYGNTENKSESEKPSNYYWRDFYGMIPSDAFPIGDENQYPQTYVGLVYDPLNNGTYVTTIVDGLDYVYNVVDGKLFKKTSSIQILCTSKPESLTWMTLSSENASSVSDYLVTAGVHQEKNKDGIKHFRAFVVVKLSNFKISYASSTASLDEKLEYATMDGALQKSVDKIFLLYIKNSTQSNEKRKKPFISYSHRYSIRCDSIIPNFYGQINVGSCSFTCTNEGMDRKQKKEINGKSANAMEYYWQPQQIFNKNEALEAGTDFNDKIVYVGQAYSTSNNLLDVGLGTNSSVAIAANKYVIIELLDNHILSTTNPERFEWVNTTFENFASLDKTRLIPGGEFDNGTKTFVGRLFVYGVLSPASVRFFESGLYYGYSYYGNSANVQLLMLKKKN